MHDRHIEADAEMMLAGAWLRPAYYGADSESATHNEATNVRENVGLMDVSTLGGLDVKGLTRRSFSTVFTHSHMRANKLVALVMC